MGFASGSVSFRRFLVVGKHPRQVDEKILEKLAEHTLTAGEFGVPDEVEYGWCGGRHIFDAKFTFENNVFADALHFALRIDTNKVPGELKKAYQLMEEEATAANNPSGHISKKQKTDVKEIVRDKIEEDMRSGKFRRSKLIPLLWDFPTRTIYSSIPNSSLDKLHELFERTFELKLEPVSSGSAALSWCEEAQRRHEYEDTRPTRFVSGPEGERQVPEYPWTAKGPQPKDFLGNEFLLWLWHEAEARNGVITAADLEIALVIDKNLELDCAYGQTGKDGLRGEGPTQMPEALDGLRTGKVPRKMGLILDTAGRQFEMTFNGETLGVSGCKFPEVEEAEDARVLFEERIAMLRDLCKGIDALFGSFLKVRTSSAWESQTTSLRRWITQAQKQMAVA